MSTIGPALPPPAIAPSHSYSPLGKPVVGLESADAKNQTLPPVEESNRSDRNRDRTGARTDAPSADADRRRGGGAGDDSGDPTDNELKEVHEATAHAAVGGTLTAGPSFRFVAGLDGQPRAAAALEPATQEGAAARPGGAAEAASAFQSAASERVPGELLDQRI